MEREQIKKALECCHTKGKDCLDCPYENDHSSCIYLEKNALALIKELTEENERLRAIPEQLHKEMSERMVEERKIERKLAVRKMQERLNKHFCHDPAFLGVEQRLINDVIDLIAKEMLEGE